MALNKAHMIHTEGDGVLGDTDENDVKLLVQNLGDKDHIVIHLHGGLVGKSRGIKEGDRLIKHYAEAGAHAVVFVWETGPFETVFNNLEEIVEEPVFQVLFQKLLKWVWGKALKSTGVKGVGGSLRFPTDIEVKTAIKTFSEETPFEEFSPDASLSELTPAEESAFRRELAADLVLQEELQAIVNANLPETDTDVVTARGATVRTRRSSKTLLSGDVVDELVEDADSTVKAGVLEVASFLIRARKILQATLKRFREGRDHGPYTTIVEEILRELYLANIGAVLWQTMKKDASDTFVKVEGSPARGGWSLVEELGHLLEEGQGPKVSIVGHSTGAVFACHLLRHAAAARKDPHHPLPLDFQFENVVFLAPAADFNLFSGTLDVSGDLIGRFRMFALKEALESGYWEAPLYKGSLLYMVSGLFERDNAGKSAYDRPIIGMQRFHRDTAVYQDPAIEKARAYMGEGAHRAVWSVVEGGPPGTNADSRKHGELDDTGPSVPDGPGEPKTTMQSVNLMLAEGR